MSSSVAVAKPSTRLVSGKQIMSLLGIVPLGAYVVAHLWTNLYSLGGDKVFDEHLKTTNSSPAFIFLEVFGLGLPILVHAWMGLKIIARGRPNIGSYRFFSNLRFGLQRLSGLGVLLFLGAHVVKARILPAFGYGEHLVGGHESYAGMQAAFAEPATLTVYALGILGVAYHLGNGVWGAGMTLGLTTTPKAQARMEKVSMVFFLVLLAMGYLAIWGFHPFAQAAG